MLTDEDLRYLDFVAGEFQLEFETIYCIFNHTSVSSLFVLAFWPYLLKRPTYRALEVA